MDGHTGPQESLDPVEPRIYVASLSDYNNGHLHGCWIRAAQPPERIYDEIHQMLAASPSPSAEEWAIHDHEGFGPLSLDAESIDAISRIAFQLAGVPCAKQAAHRSASDTICTTSSRVL